MKGHYRSPTSGKRSLAAALIAAVMVAGGIVLALDVPSGMPAPVAAPDTTRRFTTTEPLYLLPPLPKALPPVPARPVAGRPPGPGIYKCEEAGSPVTYSQYPCDDAQLVDTRPASGGFAENWSISVKKTD